MIIKKSLKSFTAGWLYLKIISIGFLMLTGCGKQVETSTKLKETFSPSEYVVLTNLNLNNIQPSRHKQLIDELNLQPCKCPDCTPGISLAQCVSTNNYCSYSMAEAGKIIKNYQKVHYTTRKLTFSIWDASRSGDINGIFRHLVRNTPVDSENVKGETPLLLSLKSDNYESSVFLILSGAPLDGEGEKSAAQLIVLEKKDWANKINENLSKYKNKFTFPIHETLSKIIHKAGWSLEKTKLLSIKFKEWPDMSVGGNTEGAKLQVITKGISILMNYNNIRHELKLLYDSDLKCVKLVELQSAKVILYSGLDF